MSIATLANLLVTKQIVIKTERAPQFIDLTDQVQQVVEESGIRHGQVVVFTRHTTAAIRINENEPELMRDFVAFLERIAPESARYFHNDFEIRTVNMTDDECANAHAHCRQLLMATSETVPIVNGELCLGTWQRIFLVELDHARDRSVIIQVLGQ